MERVAAARALLTSGLTVSAAARSMGVPRSTLVDSLARDPSTSQVKEAECATS